ncbi:MAG: tRNA (cytidine(34)-2'-O)-methyltransferase [Planctomycetota bacterium]|jgi:tRNA (cytidine/uridine-2'-O-)-methyltransferase
MPPIDHDEPLLHLVLDRPEIPNNTGNIGRTALAVGARLHLIHPLGFDLSEKACRRAGLDYWPHLDWCEHADFDAYTSTSPRRVWLFTTRSDLPHWDAPIRPGDHLLFGRETSGAGPEVHRWIETTFGPDHRLRLPMIRRPEARSLNLATAVAIAAYDAMRRFRGLPDLRSDPRLPA